jgi:hypothetical protein
LVWLKNQHFNYLPSIKIFCLAKNFCPPEDPDTTAEQLCLNPSFTPAEKRCGP